MAAATPPESRFVRVGELQLHYLDFGGDGPPLLFSHATGFHAWLWVPYARRFTRRFRVLALDHRGHGASDRPATSYAWERFGEDLAGFCDALGLDDVHAVGHSKGATAIAAAAMLSGRRFTRAALIDPVLVSSMPGLTEPVWEMPMATATRRRRAVWPSRAVMLDTLRAKPPLVTWAEELARLYVDHGVYDRPDGQVELCCPPEIEAQVYAWMPLSDGFRFLPHLACPTLVVRGVDSPAFGERGAAQAMELLPSARLVAVPGAGHFVPMERPDEVGAALEEFLMVETGRRP